MSADAELAEAFKHSAQIFMQKYSITEDVLLDMYLGTVVGNAIRRGETREAVAARALAAYDQILVAAQRAGL